MAPKAEKKPAAKKPAEEPAAETAPTGKKSRAEKRLPAGKSAGKEGDLNDGAYDGYAGDIWSFGLSILEFYLDRFPLGENLGKQGDWAALMCAICYSDSPQAPRNASPDFKNFISLCLQKNPASRPSAMRLLQHPFVNPPQPQPQLQPQPLAATDSPQFRPIDY